MIPINITFPPKKKWMNESFIPYFDNRDRYLIFIGGRGSGKSDFVSKMIVLRLLSDRYLRGICYRSFYNTLKDSCFKSIVDNIKNMKLDKFFKINQSPLKISCVSGNEIVFRGGDDVSKLKSMTNINFLWIEEDIPQNYDDFVTINTTVRCKRSDYIQTIFTVNPIVKGDYTDNWFYKYFEYDKQSDMTFSFNKKIIVEKKLNQTSTKKIETSQKVTSMKSTYKDNRFLSNDFVSTLEALKYDDTYTYAVNTLGIWSRKLSTNQFFKKFNISKNTVESYEYNQNLPIHISFDFNVNPGLHAAMFQVDGKKIMIIDEVRMITPNNTTKDLCSFIKNKYNNHTTGMYIYGDASGKHQDTRSEKGWNDFTIIENELAHFHPILRVPNSNPPIVISKEWINSIFDNKSNLDLKIPLNCKILLDDILYLQEDSDGTTLKQKIKDKESGVTYEKYGHMADLFRYFMCSCFQTEFNSFKNGGKDLKMTVGVNKNKYDW